MKPKRYPSHKYLRACFSYNPLTGDIFWKERPRSHFKTMHGCRIFNKKFPGRKAGTKHFQRDGRPSGIRICMSARARPSAFYVHRIIYSLMGSGIPNGFEVDHRDTNPFNNKWSNLRLATGSQNSANRSAYKCRHLPKGVSTNPNYKGYIAQTGICGTHQYLGVFDTPQDAHAAYLKKAQELSGEFARSA